MENMPMPYTRLVERVDFSPESIHDTPARNWRERRQKARVIAEHIGGDEAEAKSWQSIK